jgi:hypothetical protein
MNKVNNVGRKHRARMAGASEFLFDVGRRSCRVVAWRRPMRRASEALNPARRKRPAQERNKP